MVARLEDLDETALKAGSVGYWAGLVAPAALGGLVGATRGEAVGSAVSGLAVGVFVLGALVAGATAGVALLRPSLPGAVDRRRRGRAVVHGAAAAALWDVVAVFAVGVTASQAPVGGAPPADPVGAAARTALSVGLAKGVVLGATGAVAGLLLGPPLLGWD